MGSNAWTINHEFIVSDSFVVASPVELTTLEFTVWLPTGSSLVSVELGISSLPYYGGTESLDFVVPTTQGACSGMVVEAPDLTYTICGETVTLPPNENLAAGTYWLSLSNAYVTTGQICNINNPPWGPPCPAYWSEVDGPSAAQENDTGSIGSEAFTLYGVPLTFSPVLLDPVDSGYLSGSQITTNTSILSQGGRVITNVAADGTTEALVRIKTNSANEALTVTVLDENGNPTNDVTNCGGLFPLGGSPQSAATSLPLTSDDTSTAYAIYVSPVNFARSSQDYTLGSRAFSLQVNPADIPNDTVTANASLLRPPVVLVHGLWAQPADWSEFAPPVDDPRFFVRAVDYHSQFVQGVTATNPTYSILQIDPTHIRANSMGFSYNYPSVDTQIRGFISDFKRSNNAAAVQADVVAHSLGGDIARTIALEPGYLSDDTYGYGPIDKLITIGTPHLGTPLAYYVLQDNNECVREMLATQGNKSFSTVTTTGGTLNGAIGDLQGDGRGVYLSPALLLFHGVQTPFAMALVSAVTYGGNNLSGLDCTLNCVASWLRFGCFPDPLALRFTSTEWINVFGQYNDGAVPLTSQLNNVTAGPNTPTLPGVIHSEGLVDLDFSPPSELDPGSGVPYTTVNLLNESPKGPDFQ